MLASQAYMYFKDIKVGNRFGVSIKLWTGTRFVVVYQKVSATRARIVAATAEANGLIRWAGVPPVVQRPTAESVAFSKTAGSTPIAVDMNPMMPVLVGEAYDKL